MGSRKSHDDILSNNIWSTISALHLSRYKKLQLVKINFNLWRLREHWSFLTVAEFPDKIFDDFEMHLFKDHSLGANILGTKESVQKLKSSDLKDFAKTHFVKNNLVISYVGDLDIEKLKKSFH